MKNSQFLPNDFPLFCALPNHFYVVTDGTDRFTRYSSNFCERLGYSQEEFDKISFFTLIHPEDLAKTLSAFSELASQHSPVNEVSGFLNRYLCKDRSVVWLYWSAKSMENGLTYSIAQEVTSLVLRESSVVSLKSKEEVIEELTSIELDIFSILTAQFGMGVSKKLLTEAIYRDCRVQDHTINVHISNLRKKLKGSIYVIKNVGKGRWKLIDKTNPTALVKIDEQIYEEAES